MSDKAYSNGNESGNEYQTLEDLVGEGWVKADVEPIEPPRAEWTIGEVSLVLGGTQYGHQPVDGYTEGSMTILTYKIDGYTVKTDTDYSPHEDTHTIKVEK